MQWKYIQISGVPCHVSEAGAIVCHIYLSLAGRYVKDVFNAGRFAGREYYEDLEGAKDVTFE